MPIRRFDNKLFNKLNNDEIIINFLEKVRKAVPPSTIVLATGLSPAKVSQRLRVLRRYGKIKVFYRRLPLYSVKGDKNEN